MSRLRPLQFAAWKGGARSVSQYLMVATCHGRHHQIWNVNVAGSVAVLVANPVVDGSLVSSMGFSRSLADDPRYEQWRSWVRAMFLPRAFDHRMTCTGKERTLGAISTVGTFEFGGGVYAVESHPGEIRVTDAAGCDTAVIPFKTGAVLGTAAPGEGSAPAELLDAMRECAIRVLEQAADDGRGPWAMLERRLH